MRAFAIGLAAAWLRDHARGAVRVRFDVIAWHVQRREGLEGWRWHIRHIEGAFDAGA